MNSTTKNALEGIAIAFVVIIIALLLLPLNALILKIVWNYVMPTLFELPTISFWHSFAILIMRYLLLPTSVIKK